MKTVTLGNLLLSSQYGTNEAPNPDGNIDVIGMKNIVDGKIDTRNLSKAQMSDKEINDYLLSRGDILINRTNSIDLVGKTGIYDSDQRAVFASYLVRLKPDLQKVNPYYLNYWLNGQAAQKTIKRIVTKAVSQANINPTELKKHCHIALPSLDKQAKAVEILQSMDATIETTERLIVAKERYFDGLMQKLFQQNPDIHSWKPINLSKILVSKEKKKAAMNHNMQLVAIGVYGMRLRSEIYSKELSKDTSNYIIFSNREICFGLGSNELVFAVNSHNEDYLVSTAYNIFHIHNSIHPNFLEYYLRFLNKFLSTKYLIISARQGKSVDFQGLFKEKILFPHLEQQIKITEVLNTAKIEIDLLKKLAESYRTQKRGLMQKLLSGEWRVAA